MPTLSREVLNGTLGSMQWAKQKGFTIVELLVVVVVIAILASVTVLAYNGIIERTKNTNFLATMDEYEKAVRMYDAQYGTYPSSEVDGAIYLVCLGDTYPAENGFSEGYCVTDATNPDMASQANKVLPSLNQQLSQFIRPLPDTSDMVFHIGGSPLARGIFYQGGYDIVAGHFAILYYYADGDRACGRGEKQTATVGSDLVTVCTISLTHS